MKKRLTKKDKVNALVALIGLVESQSKKSAALIWGDYEKTVEIRRLNAEQADLNASILQRILGGEFGKVDTFQDQERVIARILR